ncbi:hypothetical protein [Cyanobium sp. N5-Cardenillas]|uniref:hypothetical protein n=1 Tax=Cyanobium sp. N5-Cardenillas TaxID=2823720 RepID=UPI0020CC4146|nr:hypothetical protein [Cyanobium sp. N5-Cardenillas]MCP9786009.1 hypothetical protein [Cyanobium sp. N5-Cardenillas]
MPASAPIDPSWWNTSAGEESPVRAQLQQHAIFHLRQGGHVVNTPMSRAERRRVDRLVERVLPMGMTDAMTFIENFAHS